MRLHPLLVLSLAAAFTGTIGAQTTASPHGALALSCATCHTADAWKPARVTDVFKHAPERFPLDGAHARTGCTTCHQRLDFTGVDRSCASCHEDVHRGELGADCARCHTTRSFVDDPGMKRAHELTRFPLRGAHAVASCTACHPAGGSGQLQFVNRSTTCVSCHAADARAVTSPDHQAVGFTGECTSCHGLGTWKNARFDHASTAFPLAGAHIGASCESCHADRVYRGKDTQCVACHRSDYDRAANPAHAGAFPLDCASCHGNTEWKGAQFDHDATRFALTGAHQAIACTGCHADGVYRARSMECASCHQSDFNATTNPPHGAAGFTAPCTSCHTTSAWTGAVFNHDASSFPLTGSHQAASCTGCHADGVFNGKPTTCVSCHRSQYDATTTPAHAAAGYSTDCASCHATATWSGAAFDHGATRFPLTGAHLATSCQLCHGDNVYRGKTTECSGCHQSDYAATTRPPHGASGIGTTCTGCHTTAAWIPGSFDHGATAFPLTGAHTSATCLGCHGDGVYRGKSKECVSCHQADYAATTNPSHTAASFPTACASCHTTVTWSGAMFNHDAQYFPIYSGKHRGKWSSCSTCHTSPSDYSAFTCLTCHEHRQSEMDGKHQGRSGYSYTSAACLACHPRGD